MQQDNRSAESPSGCRDTGPAFQVRGDKVTGTVGAPGTGLSYRQTLVDGSGVGSSETAGSEPYRGRPWRGVLWMVLIALGLYRAACKNESLDPIDDSRYNLAID
jgi:hypothetical protein